MSVFYVFDKVSLRKVGKDGGYESERGAKAAMTKLKNARHKPFSFENLMVGSYEEFKALDVMVPTVNLLSGKECMIRKSEKGTCCDPATESYHSM